MMKIRSAEFSASATSSAAYPADGLPEVVLIGRSNVGKSSLINTLVNRKGLARTSSAPGKTRTINFYRINGAFYLVDLPGFGYANVPARMQKTWQKMLDRYIYERETIAGALIILDIRRDAGENEDDLYRWVGGLSLPVETILTKTDKLSANQVSSRSSQIKKALDLSSPVLFSAVTGAGKTELLKKIEGMLLQGPAGLTQPDPH